MKKIVIGLILFFVFVAGISHAQEKIKVACVGNSITFGARIKDRIKDAYPVVLGNMLGEGYEVQNFGVSARTILKKGDHPYSKEATFEAAKDYNPDIVIFKLGTNDTKARNWKFKNELEEDLTDLISEFTGLPSHPKVYLCKPVPAFTDKLSKKINDSILVNGVIPILERVAKKMELNVIDLRTPFLNKANLFPDKIHPNAEGAAQMSALIYKSITGQQSQYKSLKYLGVESKWKGFRKFDFQFHPMYTGAGRIKKRGAFLGSHERIQARLVVPNKALAGNPWVWRARFPDWHTEMDSILLSKGFHIAYLNTNNRFGSPKAMELWDAFYEYLTQMHGLSEKVSLEGVSRGGLFVYGWAKQNPEKINCIYAEAPVCDFKTWPAGFGLSEGSKNSWIKLKEEYGFKSDAEAKAWANQPLDSLQNLAKAKVPIMHMVGLQDKVVPPTENTFKLVDRYIKLGGPATIIPCTKGKQKLQGHHFPIETPMLGADFIIYNTNLPKELLPSKNYHNIRGGIRNSLLKFKRDKKGRVAFLGGSITHNRGWRDSICSYLQTRFPDTEFDFVAAGIPSMGTTPAAFRLVRDVLSKGSVDLLFEEAAVNDAGNGRSDLEQTRAMEGIVRHVRQENPEADIVLMHFVDPNKIETYRSGKIPQVIQNHEKIASYYNLPSINLAKEVSDRIDAGEFTWEDDFKNLHPSPFGQGIYAHSMLQFLDDAFLGHIDTDDKIAIYKLPQPIDLANYDNGMLVLAENARFGKAWEIVEDWIPADKKKTRPNYNKVPMLVGEQNSGILKFSFEGNTVGIAVASGPDAGIIEYCVDGGSWQKQDLFTRWSKNLHLPWYYTLATDLDNKNHTLKVRISEEKNKQSIGHVCRIRYFFVNN
ncbi:GDSL-type esterase/lipase family protein [Ancylomarina sp. 16SWW S1-10-2]|uniref:SGNH/GDSL hydrolase family protein n=1 Tax=Ancylomarina sp. 16SWW S1-10-2 TaxID=2499681 RepID=UPI0012AE00A4|nr:GDSL-type esterase/lipase family protein [Ancylomarina sp. 16SWW S1-10-2]MRT93795.1 SGNH/GDSL hydrolase family protein [Ancylomarina sp. 16SWW S1-10-2]